MAKQTNCQANGANMTVKGKGDIFVALVTLLGGIGAVALAFWMFPWEANQTQTIELLPLPAAEGRLSENPKPVYVFRDTFLVLAEGERVTMAVEETRIVYEFVLKGISFRSSQSAGTSRKYRVAGEEYKIRDGVFMRPLTRNNAVAFIFSGFVFLMGILMVGFPFFIRSSPFRRR